MRRIFSIRVRNTDAHRLHAPMSLSIDLDRSGGSSAWVLLCGPFLREYFARAITDVLSTIVEGGIARTRREVGWGQALVLQRGNEVRGFLEIWEADDGIGWRQYEDDDTGSSLILRHDFSQSSVRLSCRRIHNDLVARAQHHISE